MLFRSKIEINNSDYWGQILYPVFSIFLPLASIMVCFGVGYAANEFGIHSGWISVAYGLILYIGCITCPLAFRDHLNDIREIYDVQKRWGNFSIGWVWAGSSMMICVIALYSWFALGFYNQPKDVVIIPPTQVLVSTTQPTEKTSPVSKEIQPKAIEPIVVTSNEVEITPPEPDMVFEIASLNDIRVDMTQRAYETITTAISYNKNQQNYKRSFQFIDKLSNLKQSTIHYEREAKRCDSNKCIIANLKQQIVRVQNVLDTMGE